MKTVEITYVEEQPLLTVGQATKLLNLGIGRTKMMILLRQWKFILSKNEPAQSMIDRGYVRYVFKTIETYGDKKIQVPCSYVTVKGLVFLGKFYSRIIKNSKNETVERVYQKKD